MQRWWTGGPGRTCSRGGYPRPGGSSPGAVAGRHGAASLCAGTGEGDLDFRDRAAAVASELTLGATAYGGASAPRLGGLALRKDTVTSIDNNNDYIDDWEGTWGAVIRGRFNHRDRRGT